MEDVTRIGFNPHGGPFLHGVPAQEILRPSPFNLAFNVAVLRMAELVLPAGYDVAFDGSAPETLEALQDHAHEHRRIMVDGRNSDKTIFGDAEVNYAFRAWHDATHLRIAAPFNLDGEMAVAHRQIEDVTRVFGHGAYDLPLWRDLIFGEVYGQALYHAREGQFPADQRAFMREWLSGLGYCVEETPCGEVRIYSRRVA